MYNLKKIFALQFVFLLSGLDLFAQSDALQSDSAWRNYINLQQYSKPFWKADTIIDESVLLVKENDTTSARLLFKAKKILAVKAANYSPVFIQGKDWDYNNGKLIFGRESGVPFLYQADLVFSKAVPGGSMPGKTAGTYVFFNEGAYLASKQIAVTYIKDKSAVWQGPVPTFAKNDLPNTIGKLKSETPLKIVFYGNSIEVGYNASGLEKKPPFMPVWPELVVNNLKTRYKVRISSVNKSIAGKLARWGLDSVQSRVIVENPDLVIIGFGMNDGTANVPADTYRSEIKGIIDAVKAKNPLAEFILIAPMLANPVSSFSGLQAVYLSELKKLTQKGIVVANITGVHEELLKYKSYQDMTGNNINHPNDYLARWYAQFISGLLIK